MMRQDRFTEGAQEVLAAVTCHPEPQRRVWRGAGQARVWTGPDARSPERAVCPTPDSFAKGRCAARGRLGAQNDNG